MLSSNVPAKMRERESSNKQNWETLSINHLTVLFLHPICSAFGELVDRYYQFDKNFLDGGGDFNDKTDSDTPRAKDTRRLATFESLTEGKTRIGFPYYDALVGYAEANELVDGPLMSNFQECNLNAVMCCTTSSRGNPFVPNADVCHVDLAVSRRSACTYHGEAHYEGTDQASCIGFSWADGSDSDRFKGNLLYEISYKLFKDTGYIKNVPGAPMCGCVEQMPVVTNSACKTIDSVTNEAYIVALSEDDGDLSVRSAPGMTVSVKDCGAPLIDWYDGPEQDGMAKRIVSPNCDVSRREFLNDQYYVPHDGYNPFVVQPTSGVDLEMVAGQGLYFLPDVNYLDYAARDADFRDKLSRSQTKIVYRHCPSCLPSHQHLYTLVKETPTPEQVNFLDLFLNNWRKDNDNGLAWVLGTHFEIYTNYADAVGDTKNPDTQFKYCTYGHANVGFPYDCGLEWRTQCMWNNYNGNKDVCGGYYSSQNTAFYVDMTSVEAV